MVKNMEHKDMNNEKIIKEFKEKYIKFLTPTRDPNELEFYEGMGEKKTIKFFEAFLKEKLEEAYQEGQEHLVQMDAYGRKKVICEKCKLEDKNVK